MTENNCEIIAIRKIIKTKAFPFSDSTIRRLIRNGIKKQHGNLPEGEQYLMAMNMGNAQTPRWFVSKHELDRWFKSKLNQ